MCWILVFLRLRVLGCKRATIFFVLLPGTFFVDCVVCFFAAPPAARQQPTPYQPPPATTPCFVDWWSLSTSFLRSPGCFLSHLDYIFFVPF